MTDMTDRQGYPQCLRREMITPVGGLALYAGLESLLAIEFKDLAADSPLCLDASAVLLETERQLLAYFSGRLAIFHLPLQPVGTDFQMSVWRAMQDIPYGETRTYGEIAEKVGGRNKARAVGQAANKNPLPIVIPCHRVLGTGNRLTGFAPGIAKKAILLNHEQGAGIW